MSPFHRWCLLRILVEEVFFLLPSYESEQYLLNKVCIDVSFSSDKHNFSYTSNIYNKTK